MIPPGYIFPDNRSNFIGNEPAMRTGLIILLLFFVLPSSAQGEAEKLALKLTANCKTDREKVTKIFYWITDNIAYRTRSNRIPVIGAGSRRYNRDKSGEEEDDTSALKPLNERVAETVIRNRLAVCDGYARLFATLCGYAGIKAEIIIGYARSNSDRPGSKFGVNHYWNAVFFEGKWYLLDAAWASGYIILPSGEFVRNYNPKYFLTDPEVFIRDHFPDHPQWTLLPGSVMPDEFRRSPFRQKSFIKYRITSFYPAKGIIEASVGDVVELELITADALQDKRIGADYNADSFRIYPPPSSVCLTPLEEDALQEGQYKYVFKVEDPGVEWLYLFYNKDLVLRYKVNIKKKGT